MDQDGEVDHDDDSRRAGKSAEWSRRGGSWRRPLYGQADAARLKAAAGVSVYGGFDEQSIEDITGRAGETQVVTASRGGIAGNRQESVTQFDVLTAADTQQLAVGESVMVARHLLPFLAFTPALHEMGSMERAVKREGRLLDQRSVRA